jgi:hypothetical protein
MGKGWVEGMCTGRRYKDLGESEEGQDVAGWDLPWGLGDRRKGNRVLKHPRAPSAPFEQAGSIKSWNFLPGNLSHPVYVWGP